MAARIIAVVGSGISGLAAAWLLARRHRVILIEQDGRLGGHSNTVAVTAPEGEVPIDTGFIVYNGASYPNLVALFRHLGVATHRTSMGFAVSLVDGAYEYSGTGAGGVFGQGANIASLAHWRMVGDILRFFREAREIARTPAAAETALGEWLAGRGYSKAFVDRHILPMGAAIWSAPAHEILGFPVASFARFFDNHGLLQVRNRPEWRTVVGGSRVYVEKLLADQPIEVMAGDGAQSVVRGEDGARVVLRSGREIRADHVVIAAHADDALALLGDADGEERRILRSFRYTKNTAVLHWDERHMPKRRRVWAAWNVTGNALDGSGDLAVTYWMNRLQPLPTRRDYFVSVNPLHGIAAGREIARFDYAHPVIDGAARSAQQELWSLQGRRRTWFCGSYFGFGFHEDGLQSGLAVAEELGEVRRPWSVANESGRIVLGRRALAQAAQ